MLAQSKILDTGYKAISLDKYKSILDSLDGYALDYVRNIANCRRLADGTRLIDRFLACAMIQYSKHEDGHMDTKGRTWSMSAAVYQTIYTLRKIRGYKPESGQSSALSMLSAIELLETQQQERRTKLATVTLSDDIRVYYDYGNGKNSAIHEYRNNAASLGHKIRRQFTKKVHARIDAILSISGSDFITWYDNISGYDMMFLKNCNRKLTDYMLTVKGLAATLYYCNKYGKVNKE